MKARLWIAGVILAMVSAGALWWEGRAGQGAEREKQPVAFRYPFARTPKGEVVNSLRREIAFYQQRSARDPQGGLDLASLATAYLKMARATGDLSWYLLADQAARRSLANLPYQNSAALLVLAQIAEARHDFREAVRLALLGSGAPASIEFANPGTLAILVKSHLATGNIPEADRAAWILLDRIPSVGSYTLRALTRLARGRDEEAIQDFRRAIAAEEAGETGSSAWARTLLGRVHYRHGRLTEARALYEEALRILPQYPLALLYLAELEVRMGNYRAAERHFASVVTISAASPNSFDHAVLRGLGRIKALQGDRAASDSLWQEAEARLRRDVAGGSFGHRRELARLLLERGRAADVDEALRLMKEEVTVRQDAETLDTLAWALVKAEKREEARRAARAALRWGVRDAAMLYRAATIEQALGNRSAAESLFQRGRAVDPTFDARAQQAAGFGTE